MMERLFQNANWLKIFSVALAILLWATVMPQYTRQETRTFEVPLQVIEHPEFQRYEGPSGNETVQIQVTGMNLVLARLKKEQFRAWIDYSRIREPGKPTQLEVQVDMQVDESAAEDLSYQVIPPSYTVTLIEMAEASVPVVVEPSAGERTFDGQEWRFAARPEIEQVILRGRSDFLEKVRLGRVVLEEGELLPHLSRLEKAVIPVDGSGREVSGLESPTVGVKVTWEQLPPGRLFQVQPVTTGELPIGYEVVSVTAEPRNVMVRAGTLDGELPAEEFVETVPIDVSGRQKSFIATVGLVPPMGATVEPSTVNVTVNIGETTVEKVFQGLPLEVRGQAENMQVSLATESVEIRVKGPYSIVTPLDASAFEVYVDVAGVAGGQQMVPVRVSWPPGVTSVDVSPALVSVTISEQ